MILTGELAPGDRLPPEANLAANLGLSRTSLREAVRALTVLGVIDTRQGDASYITSLGPELLLGALGLAVDLQREDAMPDLVAVRRILEPAATAMAASRITVEEIQRLRSLIPSTLDDEQATSSSSSTGSFTTPSPAPAATTLLLVLLDGLRPADHTDAHLAWAHHSRESWSGPWTSTRRSSTRSKSHDRGLGACRRHRPRRRPRGLDPHPRSPAGAPSPHAQSTPTARTPGASSKSKCRAQDAPGNWRAHNTPSCKHQVDIPRGQPAARRARTDKKAPFDLAGTKTDGTARPYNTAKLADGTHTIRVVMTWANGTTSTRRGRFKVHNGGAKPTPTPTTTASPTTAPPRPRRHDGTGHNGTSHNGTGHDGTSHNGTSHRQHRHTHQPQRHQPRQHQPHDSHGYGYTA